MTHNDAPTTRILTHTCLANIVEHGGAAKALLADEQVRVNGEVEIRRGRQISKGDLVEVDGVAFTVA